MRSPMRLSLLFAFVSSLALACGQNGNDGPGFLPVGEQSSCKASCTAHATPTCTSECQSSCDGICSGTMPASSFPEVDSIDCTPTSVTFHSGSASLSCNP